MSNREVKGYSARTRKFERTLLFTDADYALAGATATIALGTLPAGAQVVSVDCRLTTPFTGGSISNVLLDLGTTGDVDAVRDGISLFAAAVDGRASTHPMGIAPGASYDAATVLNMTIVATGANLNAATAGSAKVIVEYSVPDSGT
jgi:hypothetical protein